MQSNGLATILLMIPVIAVPALAIFGIPQFAPVVASPLDEGRDNDRESRVGNSERPVHEEMFGDFDDFSSANASNEKADRRDSFLGSRSKRKLNSKGAKEAVASEWDRDSETESDWPSNPRRRTAVADTPKSETDPAPPRSRKRNLLSDRSSGNDRRSAPQRNEEEIRLASAVDEEQSSIVQSNFTDDFEAPPRTASAFEGAAPSQQRGQKEDSRRRPKAATANEPLTWKSAVERLNELEIRNFRLEPGHQNGQFVFICSYTASDTPRVSYRFEAGADEPLKAVEKVLEQIAEWQQRR